MKRSLLAALFLSAAFPAIAGGIFDINGKAIDEYTFAIRGRGWGSREDSGVQESTRSVEGSVIQCDRDLGMGKYNYIPEGEAEFRYKELAIHLQGWWAHNSANHILQRDTAFDGIIFLAGDRVNSRISIAQAAVHFEWLPIDLGSSKKIGLEIGVIAGLRWTHFEADVRNTSTGLDFRSTITGILPDVGITACFGFLNIVELDAQLSGFTLPLKTYDYHSININVELRIFLDEHFYIGGGYRLASAYFERGDRRRDGDLIEYLYQGPMVTIGVQF